MSKQRSHDDDNSAGFAAQPARRKAKAARRAGRDGSPESHDDWVRTSQPKWLTEDCLKAGGLGDDHLETLRAVRELVRGGAGQADLYMGVYAGASDVGKTPRLTLNLVIGSQHRSPKIRHGTSSKQPVPSVFGFGGFGRRDCSSSGTI